MNTRRISLHKRDIQEVTNRLKIHRLIAMKGKSKLINEMLKISENLNPGYIKVKKWVSF